MPVSLIGRASDIQLLTEVIEVQQPDVVTLIGESGIGKTALAIELMETYRRSGSRFVNYASFTAFRPESAPAFLEDWLLTAVAAQMSANPVQNATRNELEDFICEQAELAPTLVFLDNVESLDQEWLTQFISKWVGSAGQSMLLMTATDLPRAIGNEAKVWVYELGGISDPADVLSLLGPQLAGALPESDLQRAAVTVKFNPQRLIYLRSMQPRNRIELSEVADALGAESIEVVAPDLARAFEGKAPATIAPFLSLGRLLTLDFDEQLLAWLWHKLGDGAADAYVSTRDWLVGNRLLDRHDGALRVHPSVHIRLERLLLQAIGPVHVRHVDYYLSEYYRRVFEQRDAPDMTLLERYFHHASESDNAGSALAYILAPERTTKFRKMGLALQFRPILAIIDGHLSSSPAEIPDRPEHHFRVKLELAHCAHDLSEHEACLRALDEAEALLSATAAPALVREEAEREINYLRGSAFSNLGQSFASVNAYFAVVESGIRGTFDARCILALGYLAFELRFHDLGLAVRLGERAVELAREVNDDGLITKNECSLGQTKFFAGDEYAAEARDALERAATSAREHALADRRELGRILIHLAMAYTSRRQFDAALALLTEAEAINQQAGDRRRRAASLAIRAIAAWRSSDGNVGEAPWVELLDDALTQHADLKDWRNAVPEALTQAYFAGHVSLGDALGAADGTSSAWSRALRSAGDEPLLLSERGETALDLFGRYWERSFRPAVLEPRPAFGSP